MFLEQPSANGGLPDHPLLHLSGGPGGGRGGALQLLDGGGDLQPGGMRLAPSRLDVTHRRDVRRQRLDLSPRGRQAAGEVVEVVEVLQLIAARGCDVRVPADRVT